MPLDVWAATLPIAPPTLAPAPATPPPTGSALTTFQLLSPNTGPAEFSLAVPLANGATSGALSTSIANSQVSVKRGWNDSSDKHVLIDGIANLVANVPLTISVINAPGSGGTILTSGNIAGNTVLQTAGQNVINLGVNGSIDLSSLLGSPVRTWRSGPWAVECHYERVVTVGTSALYVSFHVRLYQTGRIFVRAIVDNGWVELPNTDKSYTATITIGGTIVYGPISITHSANNGYLAEGWIGGDPQVTPIHNYADIVATKLVPNYFTGAPSSTALSTLTQTYTQFGHGDIEAVQPDTGFQKQIGLLPLWDALCVTSQGDSRAFNSVLVNAKSVRSYGIIWRGAGDNNLPCRPSIYPNYTVNGPSTIGPSFGGGGNPPGTVGGTLEWDPAHHGSAGYLAYLLTGEYVYLETMQHQSATSYLTVTWSNNYPSNTPGSGGTSRSLFHAAVRAPAWIDRTIGQYVAISPSDSVAADYTALLATQGALAKSVTQLAGVNQLGIIYESDLFVGAGTDISSISMFMHWFMVQAFGHVSDLQPLSDMTNWNAARDWLYKIPINMLGDGTGGTFCFSQAASYFDYNFGNTSPIISITDPHWAANWNTVWSQTVGDALDNGDGFTLSCGNTLLGNGAHAMFGDLADGGAMTSFWGNLHPTIALAVDHGAAGAAASYNRFIGASNYQTLRNNTGGTGTTADWPIFCIQPRDKMQALLSSMAPGTWADAGSVVGVTAPSMSSVAPSPTPPSNGGGSVAVTRAWSGGILDTNGSRIICWGGGHTDYAGNEVYAFNFSDLNWRLLTQPSVSDLNSTGIYVDGNPASRHTYNGLVFLPTQNKMMSVGGSVWNNGNFDNKSFLFDLAVNSWSNTGTINNNFLIPDVMAAYNPADGNVYAIGGQSATSLQKYTVATNSWSSIGGGIAGLPDSHQTGALDQTNNRLVATGANFLYHISLTTGALTNVTSLSSGDKTCQNYLGPAPQGAPGFDWHPGTSQLIGFVPGDAALYFLNPTTLVWTKHSPATANTVVPPAENATTPSSGVYGRFRYSAKYNCFVAVVDYTGDVFVYKPDF